MSTVREISDADFDSVVLQSTKPVLVDYWATWCSPCKQLAPIIEELAAHFGDDVLICKMDTEKHPITAVKYQVMSLPAIHIFKDGEIVKAFQGGKTKSSLIKAIEELL
ncbi:MAG: thioredoxin [Propionibacteriaceae bacterium]